MKVCSVRDLRLASRILISLVLLASLFACDLGSAGAVEQAPFSGRWIDVNLTKLTATAFEGSTPVYTALITAGKKGFATPTGTFRIYKRVSVTDMRSSPNDKEYYFVEDVRYAQYFKSGGYAIHANYWQPAWVFGKVNTSHGCVSMRATHALYFWKFAKIGTPVYIHYGSTQVAVPSIVGKTQAAATTRLHAAGFKVAVRQRELSDSAPGLTVEQSPAGGKRAAVGSTVTVYVAVQPLPAYRDPVDNTAWSPRLVGMTEAEALNTLEKAGLRGTYINYVDEVDLPASSRDAFKRAKPGTVVAALVLPDVELPRGSDFMIAVKR